MASATPYDALKAMKMKIEEEKIELAEKRDRLEAAKERTARIEKENEEMEAEIARIQQHSEMIQARRAERAAEMSRLRHYRQTEQLPRLEALRERLRRRLEMREQQRATFDKLDATLTETLQKNEDYYNSLPHVARLNELEKQREELEEEVRIKRELLSAKKAQLAKRRQDNREKWDAFVKFCIQACKIWKAGEEEKRLKKLEDEKLVQQLLTKSRVNVVRPWTESGFGNNQVQETVVPSGKLPFAKPKPTDEFSVMLSKLLGKTPAQPKKLINEAQPKFQTLWEEFNKTLTINQAPMKIPSPAKKGRPSYLTALDDLKVTGGVTGSCKSFTTPSSKSSEFRSNYEATFSSVPEVSTITNANCHEVLDVVRFPTESQYSAETEERQDKAAGTSSWMHENPCTPFSDGFEPTADSEKETYSPARIRMDAEKETLSPVRMEIEKETHSPARMGKQKENHSPARMRMDIEEQTHSPARMTKTPSKKHSPIRSLLASVETENYGGASSPCGFFKEPLPINANSRLQNSQTSSLGTIERALESDSFRSSEPSSRSGSPRANRTATAFGNFSPAGNFPFLNSKFDPSRDSPTRMDFFAAADAGPSTMNSPTGGEAFEINFGDDGASDNDNFNLGMSMGAFNFQESNEDTGSFF